MLNRLSFLAMSGAEITNMAFELPAEERLELARRLVESVVTPASLDLAVEQGIRRIEDVLSGKVRGISESELRAALS
jgi:hypothetical protein